MVEWTVDCKVASRFARTINNKANASRGILSGWSCPRLLSSATSACQWQLSHGDFVCLLALHVFVPHRRIDGCVYVGELKKKDKAKQQYQKDVSTGETVGLALTPVLRSSLLQTQTWGVRNKVLVPPCLKIEPDLPQSTCLSGTQNFLTNVGAAEKMSKLRRHHTGLYSLNMTWSKRRVQGSFRSRIGTHSEFTNILL